MSQGSIIEAQVPGYGNLNAEIMAVGEGGGPQEVREGKPFVGPAGKKLNQLLSLSKTARENIFVTNVVHALPSDDGKTFRAPRAEEKRAYWPLLEAEINTVNPDIILALGDHAVKTFVPDASLRESHGLCYEAEVCGRLRKVICLYHPSYFLRSPAHRVEIAWDYAGWREKLSSPVRPSEAHRAIFTPRSESDIDSVRTFALWASQRRSQVLSMDFETTGLDPHTDLVVGVSFSNGVDAWYVDARHLDEGLLFSGFILPLFQSPDLKVLLFNSKFEASFCMARTGTREPLVNFEDPQLLAYLVDQMELLGMTRQQSTRRHEAVSAPGLKEFTLRKLGVRMKKLDDILGIGRKKQDIREVRPEILASYAAADALYTYRLWEYYCARVPADLWRLYEEVDKPLSQALARMEVHGCTIDWQGLESIKQELDQELAAVRARILEQAGNPELNINSPKQLGTALKDSMPPRSRIRLKKTSTGQMSTDDESLQKMAGAGSPLAPLVLKYRELSKARGTYVENFHANPRTGRVHTEFRATSTATGRLSSGTGGGGLNFQNIPARTELGRRFRKLFTTSHKSSWVLKADSSQEELRILAHYCLPHGGKLAQAYRDGRDLHMETARRVFGRRPDFEENAGEYRRRSKTILFGVIYGLSAAGLTKQINVSYMEAQEIIDSVYAAYPEIRGYEQDCREQLARHGYVTSLQGRRMPVPEFFSKDDWAVKEGLRKAVNWRIQGTAADIIRRATIDIDRAILHHGLRSRLMLEVHDEVVLEVPEEELPTVRDVVSAALSPPGLLAIPMETEITVGETW